MRSRKNKLRRLKGGASDEFLSARIGALSSGWTNQIDAMWRVHQFASTLEAGTLVGCWFFYDNRSPLLLLAILSIANALLVIMYFTSHRHFQIQDNFQNQLRRLGVYEQGTKPKPFFGLRLYSHDMAKLVIIFVSVVNAAIGPFTIIVFWSTLNGTRGLTAAILSCLSAGLAAALVFIFLRYKCRAMGG